jgi:hypothetical protein
MTKLLLARLALSLSVLVVIASECRSETVDVKNRGLVELKSFTCVSVERSSFIQRVCYDSPNAYMIVKLNGAYYHYCGIDNTTVDAFKAADSMGRFFNASIKGHFDCKIGHLPNY